VKSQTGMKWKQSEGVFSVHSFISKCAMVYDIASQSAVKMMLKI